MTHDHSHSSSNSEASFNCNPRRKCLPCPLKDTSVPVASGIACLGRGGGEGGKGGGREGGRESERERERERERESVFRVH